MTHCAIRAAALTLLFPQALGYASSNNRFRGSSEAAMRSISIHEVKAQLSASLEAVLNRKQTSLLQKRLDGIEAAMWPTFQAVPKNALGRLSPVATRHVVHTYFAATHGWIISGLEPHGMNANMTDVHDSTILLEKVPRLVEDLLEAKQAGRGLSLADLVAMAAALEQLIFGETLDLLEIAYFFNSQTTTDLVDSETLHEILDSYMLLFEQGVVANVSDPVKHNQIKQQRLRQQDMNWHNIRMYVEDTVKNVEYMHRDTRNPWAPPVYSFEQASEIAELLLHDYGRLQDSECRGMAQALAKLDPKGTGRIPLHVFYSQPHTADYQFKESAYYLQQVGALEEGGGVPSVRIANYVQGPSNCLAHTAYYSVCCLTHCDGLMRELEGSIRAAQASTEELLVLVGNLSSVFVDAPRHLSADLQAKLQTIAGRHGGAVPLHGRLFAQWMHFAFPQECPFPHLVEDAVATTPSRWHGAKDLRATPEDKKRLADEVAAASAALSAVDPLVMEWSDEEVLLLQEPQRRGLGQAVSAVMRLVLPLSMALTVVRVGVAGLWFTKTSMDEKVSEFAV